MPLAVAGAPPRGCGSSLAPLSGAIVATGKLKVELNHKTVQHKEGGIVREILVRDGELVAAGAPLIVIGDVRNDAELACSPISSMRSASGTRARRPKPSSQRSFTRARDLASI